MSHTLVIRPEAIVEAAEIYAYHKRIGQALADRFDKELDACYKKIVPDATAGLMPSLKLRQRHCDRPALLTLVAMSCSCNPGAGPRSGRWSMAKDHGSQDMSRLSEICGSEVARLIIPMSHLLRHIAVFPIRALLILSVFGFHAIRAQNAIDSSDYLYSIDMGEYFMDYNDFETALIYFNRASLMTPINNELLVKIGYCHHMLDNNYEAIKYADIVLNRGNVSNTDSYRLKAFSYLSLDVLDSAEFYFSKIIYMYPDDVPARIYRAEIYNEMNRLDSAYSDAMHAHGLSPESSHVNYIIGSILKNMEKYDQAAEYLSRGIAIGIDYPAAYQKLGICQFYLGLFESALGNLNKSVSSSASPPMFEWELTDAVAYLALVNFELDNYSSAIDYANEALKRDSTFYMGYYVSMISSVKVEKIDKAKSIASQAAQLVPNEGMLYVGYFHLALAEGDTNKAMSYLNKASTMSSEWLKGYHYYMKLHELFNAVGDTSNAEIMLKKAIQASAGSAVGDPAPPER